MAAALAAARPSSSHATRTSFCLETLAGGQHAAAAPLAFTVSSSGAARLPPERRWCEYTAGVSLGMPLVIPLGVGTLVLMLKITLRQAQLKMHNVTTEAMHNEGQMSLTE